ncbi:MAG: cytochrome C oxidase subunit IV family protein [bacterium]
MSEAKHAHPNYIAVWAWLVLLLFVSVAAVYLPFSQALTVAFIFIVAAVKAALVAFYFMHLKFEEKLVRYIAIIPVLLFVIMTLSLIPDIAHNR